MQNKTKQNKNKTSPQKKAKILQKGLQALAFFHYNNEGFISFQKKKKYKKKDPIVEDIIKG